MSLFLDGGKLLHPYLSILQCHERSQRDPTIVAVTIIVLIVIIVTVIIIITVLVRKVEIQRILAFSRWVAVTALSASSRSFHAFALNQSCLHAFLKLHKSHGKLWRTSSCRRCFMAATVSQQERRSCTADTSQKEEILQQLSHLSSAKLKQNCACLT